MGREGPATTEITRTHRVRPHRPPLAARRWLRSLGAHMKQIQFLAIASLVLPAMLSSCAAPTPSIAYAGPGQLYQRGNLDIRAPNSDGWYVAMSSREGMAFVRRGKEPNESFAAQVLLFFPSSAARRDPQEFLSLIKKQFEEEFSVGRFSVIESEFKHAEQRSYLCVSVRSVVRDAKARVSPTLQELLLLQAKSLYCLHPRNPYADFAITYSHRGQSLYPNLDAEAQSFIDGVQVPP